MSTSSERKQANRLAKESSLYLQQHAYNPVDWYPWGEEAFARAREEDKPVLVSIGYSSCHWCHVMERESFEDPEVAAYQNEHFISIKVDREERPDVDRIYMTACQLMTGGGGWPLNAFLLPDGRPFFAGTYFPPESRHNRPSWRDLLGHIHETFQEKREVLEQDASEVRQWIARQEQAGEGESGLPSPSIWRHVTESLLRRFDRENGGFGGAPKFPGVMSLELMLRRYRRGAEPELLELVMLAMRNMAQGGLYDQLGGGFHRYSVDAQWAVPHFEKMLYDNGLLLRLYADGYRLTASPLLAKTLRHTTSYLAREMTAPEGAFYASQDADSEGEEGTFFVWTPAQIEAIVGAEQAPLLCAHLGVTTEGNFEEKRTVLSIAEDVEVLATRFSMPKDEVEAQIEAAKQALWKAREVRVKPARDPKRITAWNALVIQGLARAAAVLQAPTMLDLACRAAAHYRDALAGGPLMRIFAEPSGAAEPVWSVSAFLDDYSFLVQAFLDLGFASGDLGWLDCAVSVAEEMLTQCYDHVSHTMTYVPRDGERLIVESRSADDQAVPSAVGTAILGLQRLGLLTGEARFRDAAANLLTAYSGDLAERALGMTSVLAALEQVHAPLKMVVCVLPASAPSELRDEWRAVLASIVEPESPYVVLSANDKIGTWAHLLEGRTNVFVPTCYVCEEGSCAAPVTEYEEIKSLLQQRLLDDPTA